MPRMRNGNEKKIIRRRLINAYLSSVISISLVLLLVGAAALLLLNAKGVADYFKENMQVSVILKQEVGEERANAFMAELQKQDFIVGTRFISKEEGTREMKEMLGEDFLSVFETSPIPASIDLTLESAYVSADSLAKVEAFLKESSLVDEVSYKESLIEALNQNLAKIAALLGVVIALLLFISFALIANTVRLSVHSRRFTIHTMKLVGATKAFIRRPFLWQALVQGLASSLLSILLMFGGVLIVRKEFAGMSEIFSPGLFAASCAIVVAAGVAICTLSTFIVVGRLVSLDKDELYY